MPRNCQGEYLPNNTRLTAIPAAAIWNEFVFAMEIGWPVQVPHRCRFGPTVSQISRPTIDQPDPDPFVHVAVLELLVAAADAVFHVMTVPPAVYPVPDSSVMLEVAVGAFVPSRVLTVVGAV
jgi:hypothetical protein